jgi:L-threonylcarbamoyladenylate synthase
VNWSTPGREKHSKATDDKNMLNVAMPADALQYGSLLYATLRDLDDDGFDRLLIEAPPDDPAWLAIADRLRRAAHTP